MAIAATLDQSPSTPEKVWATLDRITQKQEEAERRWIEFDQKWDRLKEQFEETKKLFDRTDLLIEANNKEMGRLGDRFGQMVEHLVAPGIEERLGELGYHFNDDQSLRRKIKENGKVVAEIDLMLENKDIIVVAEAKAKVGKDDVEDHELRLEKLRGVYDRRGDHRRLLGVVAGAVFASEVQKAAIKAGFFVLVQSGDTMKLEIPEGFKPWEW